MNTKLPSMYRVLARWADFANARTDDYIVPFNKVPYVFIVEFDNLLIASYYDYNKNDFERHGGISSLAAQDGMMFFDLADILSTTEHHDA